MSRQKSRVELQKLIRKPSQLRFQQAYNQTERLRNTNTTTPNSTQSEPKSRTRSALGSFVALFELPNSV
ncbi:hypothetical protein KFK09_006428 [Dendrobium nobile]|uniref:Uncharacterized protein n=1 Tax=Dendrobium nobile TaxID=94219 RepID=A0A8T3BRL4_DENNO|nr:hypothetical protein KFK09_006428 [Dendrobium nobile]